MRGRALTAAAAGVLSSFCLMAWLPGAAEASPGWTAPVPFALPSAATADPSSNTTIYARGGAATSAFIEVVSTSPGKTVMHVGVTPVSGGYGDQFTVASAANAIPIAVSLAENPSGAAVIEWEDVADISGTSALTFYASYRAAGSSTWGLPVQITANGSASTSSASMSTSVAADGTAVAAADHPDLTIASPGGERIDASVVSPSGAWGTSTQVSPSGDDSENATLAFDGADNLTLAFSLSESDASNGRHSIDTVTRAGTVGVWGAATLISTDDPTAYATSAPRLGVAADGSAVISYQWAKGATIDDWATTRSGANGTWSTPVDVTPGSASAAPLGAAVSPSDKAYVLYTYQGSSSGLNCVGAVRAPVGGAFSAPACVSPMNYQPLNAVGPVFLNGDAYFAMAGQPNGGSAYDVEVDRWLDGSAQADSPTTVLAPQAQSASLLPLSTDNNGSVPVIFSEGGSTFVSAYDAAGPLLTAASVPTTAVAGQPVTMSAAFTDLWSPPVSSPSWSFGDGQSATGASVTHTYAAAGTETVDVSVSDGLGNTTTVPETIVVSPAAPVTTTTTPATTTTTPVETTTPAKPAALTLTHLSQTARRWVEVKPKSKSKTPVGTRFNFTLSEKATVTFTFTRTLSGRLVGRKCVAPTAKNKRRKGCNRHVSEALTVTGKAGANAVTFKGVVRGHAKLLRATYTVSVVAKVGGTSTKAQKLTFTIVAR